MNKIGSALVVGAGISGIRSAFDLAEVGYQVTLIDKAPNLGGALMQLDYQFPSNRCGMCKMLPLVERDRASQFCLRKGLFHENIDIMLSTELAALEGEPGTFQATLRRGQTAVDTDRCIGCGECAKICPVELPDVFNAGLAGRKAIYLPVPHNIPNHYVIDTASCTRCNECVKVCPTGAIDFDRVQDPGSQAHTVKVGAVILATGVTCFDPATSKNTYGYGVLPNVVTSVEFERMISGTGPTGGNPVRPCDGREARKIAWLQCVGSRAPQDNADYCSSICCMFALKEALLAKERTGGRAETTIFYMDMRTFGKNFQRYCDQAENDRGVLLQRCRVHSVEPAAADGDLAINYVDADGASHEEVFDMVVLAIGQRPPAGTNELAKIAGIGLNQWGFCQTEPFSLTCTARDGVFVAGAISGPRDISESVIQAGSAALRASSLIHSKGGGLADAAGPGKNFRDVSRELPQTLVALCTCGDTIADRADMEALENDVARMGSVTGVYLVQRICTNQGWQELEEILQAADANRMVIGACMPCVYARKLRLLSMKAGLDPRLLDVVDIRTAALPGRHSGKGRVIGEIRTTVSMSIGRLKRIDPIPLCYTAITGRALVVGGGIAGMTAALSVAEHGFEVNLVERTEQLGGNLRSLHLTIEGDSPVELLEKTVSMVENHPKISVHKTSRVTRCFGRTGRFLTAVENEGGRAETFEHGVVILATGARETRTGSYCYGQSTAIVTQHELEQGLAHGTIDPASLSSVAMIQCVDLREEPHNYCSRICCASALKNALHLKNRNPGIDVYIFYRDIMAYGFLEAYYTKARRAGVIFVKYDLQNRPKVAVENNRPVITAVDPILGRELVAKPDLLVLSTGMVPNDNKELADLLGVKVDRDGFFQEAESKWRPVDFMRSGIFLCGTAHSPRSVKESIATAEAAAQRALAILSRRRLAGGNIVAEVRHSLCSLCEQCIAACPYGARWRDENEQSIMIDALACQGCGSCASVCPNSASVLRGYSDQQMLGVIDAAIEGHVIG